ncbi:MAG TPA: gliding motility-associated C-terminal domain-containing protein [Saprospiraceae bacterium]|nr:gliding motility-associated C-terminal domain-containing protein [Saprospiraceae bacterium]
MIRILLTWLTMTLLNAALYSQESFHRTYPSQSGDHFQVLDGLVDGNVYYLLATIMPEIPGNSEQLFLGKFDDKGNEIWSKRILFEDALELIDFGGIHLAENDSIYFTILANREGSFRIVGAYDTGGTKGSVRLIDDGVNQRLFGHPFKMEGIGESNILHFSTHFLEEEFGTLLSMHVLEDFSSLWTKKYTASDTFDNVFNTVPVVARYFNEDSSIWVGGNCVKNGKAIPFVYKVDLMGEVIWSRMYQVNQSDFSLIINDLIALSDSTALIAGTDGGSGFVARIDTLGQVMWARDISLEGATTTLIDNITINAEGMIVCSGSASFTDVDSIYPIQLQISGGGEGIWQMKYPRVRAFQVPGGNLMPTDDGGTIYFTTNSEYNPVMNVPALIKTNIRGETTCEDSIQGNLLSELNLVSDTLVITVVDVEISMQETESNDNIPMILDIPVLSLASTIFCPREPIDFTFRATTEGAIAYLWNTGATTDTLRVMEEGMFMVTVTIDEKICFMLCDTGQVTRYDFPEIEISVNTGPFCETGSIALQMNYLMGAPIANIEWNTGEQQGGILISQPGIYSVTVTDICDEVATASINVTNFPELIRGVSINRDDDFCTNNGIRLTAVIDGGEASNIIWSNNTGGLSTVVTLAGEYTVTVRDICNNVFTASVFVDASLIKRVTNVFVSVEGDVECILNEARLTVNFDGEASNILWNTGSTNQTITVERPGVYQVAVSDACGNPINSSPFNLEECPECLTYPKVFFPRGQEELNQRFGPTLECGDIITSYELKIFNRWGNLIFESNNVDIEWDGRHNGNPAPSGVYVYFARYNVGAGQQLIKGDVTLLY